MKMFISIKENHWKCLYIHLNREEIVKHQKAYISPLKLILNYDEILSILHQKTSLNSIVSDFTLVPGTIFWCLAPSLTSFPASALLVTPGPFPQLCCVFYRAESLVYLSPALAFGAKGAASYYSATFMPQSPSGTWQVTGQELHWGLLHFLAPNQHRTLSARLISFNFFCKEEFITAFWMHHWLVSKSWLLSQKCPDYFNPEEPSGFRYSEDVMLSGNWQSSG